MQSHPNDVLDVASHRSREHSDRPRNKRRARRVVIAAGVAVAILGTGLAALAAVDGRLITYSEPAIDAPAHLELSTRSSADARGAAPSVDDLASVPSGPERIGSSNPFVGDGHPHASSAWSERRQR